MGSQVVNWCGQRWSVVPREPRQGLIRGSPRLVRARTWGGCTVRPNEEATYPEVPVIDLGDVVVPLKVAPADPALRAEMILDVRLWKPGGSGPPFPRQEDPWCSLAAARDPCTAHGFWYPAFAGGGYAGFWVWGLCVDRID